MTSMTRRTALASMGAAGLGLTTAQDAHALLVQPAFIEMRSVGRQSVAAIRAVNERSRPVTLEASVKTLIVPERGKATVAPNDGKSFLIFPPQAILQPGAQQIFRVRWVGEPTLAESQFFTIAIAELPAGMDVGAGEAGLEILYSIETIVSVAPPQGQPAMTVAGIERGQNAQGEAGVFVTIANAAPVHGVLSKSTMTIDGPNGWSRAFEPAKLGEMLGIGLIPPNRKRIVFLPIKDAPAGALSAKIQPPRRG